MTSSMKWLPLESNPDVISQYMWSVGMSKKWQFVDVLTLDPELLCMIPQPTCALVLLFPCSDKYYRYKEEEEERIKNEGQIVSKDLYYTKQTIGNACGTVALIHCVANNTRQISLEEGFLKTFIDSTRSLTPDERATKLECNEALIQAHDNFAQDGDTETPSREEEVNLHFVALIQKDGHLYELDGRKKYPINHGVSSPETFIKDAAEVCRNYMKRDPDNLRFTVIALSESSNN
ncbi:ubiquitin carboxyl-terminal hydrolase isozyme L3-like [Xenia sp. Carnegie-2017]|uniref:ubiquitin carboxyl-terminal hydrolase isozyme L3-like n=1 Tax=Xenia sp. Carnegie-2017 TaxID=2897299 RepID=UPI001F034F9A|nr:ubiquitin carboxyl-terminal hydrolase isozyme L3-like [Xenia sp. Carnegie-2017]